jgi:hypothetical protein
MLSAVTTTEVETVSRTTNVRYVRARDPVRRRPIDSGTISHLRSATSLTLVDFGSRIGLSTAFSANMLHEQDSPQAETTGLTARIWWLTGRSESNPYDNGADFAQSNLHRSCLSSVWSMMVLRRADLVAQQETMPFMGVIQPTGECLVLARRSGVILDNNQVTLFIRLHAERRI